MDCLMYLSFTGRMRREMQYATKAEAMNKTGNVIWRRKRDVNTSDMLQLATEAKSKTSTLIKAKGFINSLHMKGHGTLSNTFGREARIWKKETRILICPTKTEPELNFVMDTFNNAINEMKTIGTQQTSNDKMPEPTFPPPLQNVQSPFTYT